MLLLLTTTTKTYKSLNQMKMNKKRKNWTLYNYLTIRKIRRKLHTKVINLKTPFTWKIYIRKYLFRKRDFVYKLKCKQKLTLKNQNETLVLKYGILKIIIPLKIRQKKKTKQNRYAGF